MELEAASSIWVPLTANANITGTAIVINERKSTNFLFDSGYFLADGIARVSTVELPGQLHRIRKIQEVRSSSSAVE